MNRHRDSERRNIGGIFYDYEKTTATKNEAAWLAFAKCNGQVFLDAYLPIVKKHKNEPFTEQEKTWQQIRRGRYVEFNLLNDRGTVFGLKSGGRTESILMSLPLHVQFEYNHQVGKGHQEATLLELLQDPKEWLS